MSLDRPHRILFVCLGNICRSPAAECVFTKLVRDLGVSDDVEVDSAGTASYHEGESPDARMQDALRKRGYPVLGRARAVRDRDFQYFDHILAMDASNLVGLTKRCPPAHAHKLRLYRSLDSIGTGEGVPDPYYGGPDGFYEVIDIVERCGRALADELFGAGRR